MKKFQYTLLLVLFLFAMPNKSFAQPYVEFIAQSTDINCEANTVSIDIDIKDFIQVLSWQYTFQWDATVLDLTAGNIEDHGVISAINTTGLSSGNLPMSWFSTGGVNGTTVGDATIVTLHFDVIGNANQSSTFSFLGGPPFVEIVQYSNTLNSSQYTLTNGLLNIIDSVNPTINCPSNLTIDTNGSPTVQVVGAAATANDNCGVDFISYSLAGATMGSGMGDISNNVDFNEGLTTVTYTATDYEGNTNTCSFEVTVTNNNPITTLTLYMDNLNISCETDTVSVNVYADLFTDIRGAQFNLSWSPTALEYLDTSNIVFNSGVSFGTTNLSSGQLSFSWFNNGGLSLQNGTVLFTLNFVVNSPAGFTIPVIFANNASVPTQITSSTSFPLPVDPSEYELLNGSLFIFDNVAPTIDCPGDITVISNNGTDAIVNGITPVVFDNCEIMDTTYTLTDAATSMNIGSGSGDASGLTFPIGTTIIEYTVTDFDGNQDNCSFNVIIDIPGVITIAVDSVEVNCDANPITIGFPIKNFTDITGVQFTIEWDETQLEFLSVAQDNLTPDGIPGITQAANGIFTYSWFGASTTLQDDEEIIQLEFNVLDNTVGNSYDINFINVPTPFVIITGASFPSAVPNSQTEAVAGNVTIVDNTAPMLTCPMDTTVNANGNTTVAVNNIGATATDNCGTPTISYVAITSPPTVGMGDISGTSFPVGSTLVTYTATDGTNTTNCSFTVTVIQDNLTIECPTAVSQNTDMGMCSAAVNALPVTILSDPNNVNTISYEITGATSATGTGNIPAMSYNMGTSIITYTVTDNFGGNETCSFNVVIADGENPSISCPADITVFGGNNCSANVTWITPTATDNCDMNVVVTSTHASGDLFSIGTTEVTYYAEDNTGNIDSCKFNVIITDDDAPTLVNCPIDITVSGGNNCNSAVSWNPPTATDNCDTDIEITSTHNPDDIFTAGTTVVTYYAEDDAGNIDSCSFNITVTDSEDPMLVNCPTNMIIQGGANCSATATWTAPTATDNCDMNVQITSTHNSGDMFTAGMTVVTYYAEDDTGNIDSCNFTITITDGEAPTLVNCPSDMTLIPSGNNCNAIAMWTPPTATDNCDMNVQITSAFTPGSSFEIGTNTVTYYAIDDAGNVDSCSFNIIVEDDEAPVLSDCPTDITVSGGMNCSSIAAWNDPTATDNCDNDVQVICNPVSGSTFSAGTTVVTCYAVDNFGNLDSCKFNVIVTDTEAPMLVDCPMDRTIPAGDNCTASVFWDMPTATDNCDMMNVVITSTIQPGSSFSVGTTPVTITATDASGNTNTCTFNVTISDSEAPSIFCPADLSASTNGSTDDPNNPNFIISNTPVGCDSVILTFDNPTGGDNCFTPTVVQTDGLPSGSTFGLGVHTLEYVATDATGNTDTCEFTITVTPFLSTLNVIANPTSICTGGGTQLFVNGGTPNSTYAWTGPNGFMSNLQNPTLENLTVADSGTYIVMVTDPSTSCISPASVEIIVQQGPELALTVDLTNALCTDGTENVPLMVEVTNGIGVDSFQWENPAGTIFSTDQNALIFSATSAASGLYCVTVFGNNGCATQSCETVTITDAVETPSITSSCGGFICVGDMCNLGGTFGGNVDSVIWSATGNGPGLPATLNQNQITIQPTQNGPSVYTFTIFSNGCSAEINEPINVGSPANVANDTFDIEFNTSSFTFDVTTNDVVPGALPGDFAINITSDVKNGTLTNNGDGTFSYTPDNGFIGIDQFIYELCVECNDQTICRFATVILEVNVDGCLIPTVITPNRDKINDKFIVSCIHDFPQNEVVVYNRWGDEVYRASPYNNDWEGTYNNNDLPDGTYFYIFKKDANDSDPQKGTLTIMR